MSETELEQSLLEKLRKLPLDKQQEALDFVEALQQKGTHHRPRRSLKGLWANMLGTDITEEMIEEARREMWSNFPRDDI